mgnify:CR=1 FL=1
MSRNSPANIQLNMQQMQYQSAQLAVPNPVNSVAQANTNNSRLLLQALDSLGTGMYRFGNVIAQSNAAEQEAARQIGKAESEEWQARFKDGMLDSPEDLKAGRSPNRDWMDGMYRQAMETGRSLDEVIIEGFTQYAQDGADPDMNDRERAAYSRQFSDSVIRPAIAWARETYIKPQYEAIRENAVLALANQPLQDLGVDRGRKLSTVAAGDIERMNQQGLFVDGDTPSSMLLDAAEVAVSDGNYGRAEQLVNAAGSVTGNLLSQKAKIQSAMDKAVRGEAIKGMTELLHSTGEKSELFSIALLTMPSELRQMTMAAVKSGADETMARDLNAALGAWSAESPLPPLQQRQLIRSLRDQETRSGERLFDRSSRVYAEMTAAAMAIEDNTLTMAQQREQAEDRAKAMYSEFLELGTINGEEMTEEGMAALFADEFSDRASEFMQDYRTQKSKGFNQDPSRSRALSVELEKQLRGPGSAVFGREQVLKRAGELYAEGDLSNTDYVRIRSMALEEEKFDRVKASPEILELRTAIRTDFIGQITGFKPGIVDDIVGYQTLPAGAIGAIRNLLVNFDDDFDDFRYGDEYTAALDKKDDRTRQKLERQFRREMNEKYLRVGGLVETTAQGFIEND